MVLTQTQTTEDVVGAVSYGGLRSEVISAHVAGDGLLTFLARVTGDVAIDVSMNLTSGAGTQLAGTMVQTWRIAGFAGNMTPAGSIQGPLNKGAGTLSTESFSPAADGLVNRLRALTGR